MSGDNEEERPDSQIGTGGNFGEVLVFQPYRLAWRLAGVALAACLCLALPAGAATPAAWPFDPKLCTQDAKGKRYIAVGRAVLGIAPDPSLMLLAKELPASKRLTPPNSADEPGCPDNPQQVSIGMGTLEFVMPRFGEVQDAFGLRERWLAFGAMYGIGHDALGAHAPIQDLPVEVRSGPNLTDAVCNKPDSSITEANGVKTCRGVPRFVDSEVAYIVDPRRYGTPAGDPFRVFCGESPPAPGRSPCEVGPYAIPLGFTIGYGFRPRTSVREPDLIDRVISYDRQLREALARAVLPDYPWQDLSSPHPVVK